MNYKCGIRNGENMAPEGGLVAVQRRANGLQWNSSAGRTSNKSIELLRFSSRKVE